MFSDAVSRGRGESTYEEDLRNRRDRGGGPVMRLDGRQQLLKS